MVIPYAILPGGSISPIAKQKNALSISIKYCFGVISKFTPSRTIVIFGKDATYFRLGEPQQTDGRKKTVNIWNTVGWIFGMVISVTGFIILCWGLFRPISGDVNGTCPNATDVFLSTPEVADLNCCYWHNKGSCVNTKSLIGGKSICNSGVKPNYNNGVQSQTKQCNDLLGLMSCALFRNDSGNFITWDDKQQRIVSYKICKSFCEEMFEACQDAKDGLLFKTWGQRYVNATDFCENHFPFIVEDSNEMCFNSGPTSKTTPHLLIFILILIFILPAATRREDI